MSGRPAKRYSQGERLVAQALHLWRLGRLQPDDEARRLGVTRRTVERDLSALRDAFRAADLSLEARDGPDGRVEYRLGELRRPDQHHRWQVLAVALGVELSDFLGGERFEAETRALREQLMGKLGTGQAGKLTALLRDRLYVVKTGRKDYRGREAVVRALWDLLEALLESCVLRLHYHSPGRKAPRALVVHPLTLVINRGALYAIVELAEPCPPLAERLLLAVDRMTHTEVVPRSNRPYPPDFKADAFLSSAFEIVAGPPVRVVVEVSAAHAPYLLEHYWHASARFEPLPGAGDGRLLLHLDVAVGVDLENWLMSIADRTTVREPPELRARLQERLAAALKPYAAPEPSGTHQASP